MDDIQARRQAEAREALRQLVEVMRTAMRGKARNECRYSSTCPALRAGACPGMCC